MRFSIDRSIFEQYPDLLVGIVIVKGVNNSHTIPALTQLYIEAQQALRATPMPEKISEIPAVAIWRKAYKNYGIDPHKFSSSIERLIKRALKGEIPPISPLVDLYNLISIRYIIPAGANDLQKIIGDISFRIASAQEPAVTLIGELTAEEPKQGEPIYADDKSAICRRWNWKQDDRTKITEHTADAIFFFESLLPNSQAIITAALKDFETYINTILHAKVSSAILDTKNNIATISGEKITLSSSTPNEEINGVSIKQVDEEQKISQQHQIRVQKVDAMRAQKIEPWPSHMPAGVTHIAIARAEFESGIQEKKYSIAGRILTIRGHGKTTFVDLMDASGNIQLYLKAGELPGEKINFFNSFVDVGDILFCSGKLFKTKTGELTIYVSDLALLSKSLHPLPEKFHGLVDTETKYRQRYLDLITNKESRERFLKRSLAVSTMRTIFAEHQYVEVETPMLHPIPGGALARPFVTHHNTLAMDLYLRIAPELYLKRLVVGGIDRVYEINRNFRNEGMSTRHNPEFTMVEFYTAYATFDQIVDFVEIMLARIATIVSNQPILQFGEMQLNFSAPFARITMLDAVAKRCNFPSKNLESDDGIRTVARAHGIQCDPELSWGRCLNRLFEELVEKTLIQPTFITQFPVEISPLAKRNRNDSRFVDRFELFVAGMELANGYNELNDPFEQAARFKEQLGSHADESEKHTFDADYIQALEYGLPPTVGVGIGIDRLVMFLTNAHTIRDVILFPTLRRKD